MVTWEYPCNTHLRVKKKYIQTFLNNLNADTWKFPLSTQSLLRNNYKHFTLKWVRASVFVILFWYSCVQKKYQTFFGKCLNRVMASTANRYIFSHFTAHVKFLPKERTIKMCQSFCMTSKFVGLFTANG